MRRLKLPWPTKNTDHHGGGHVSVKDITSFYYCSIQLRVISRVTEERIRYDLEHCEACRRRYQRCIIDVLEPIRGRIERTVHNVLIKEFKRAGRVLFKKEDVKKMIEYFLIGELREILQELTKKRKKKGKK